MRQSHLDPSPFLLQGGPTGVLLIHGFTGSPPEMRLVADHLHAQGYAVSGPLLPGHGTTVEDMNRCSWGDWADHVDDAYRRLRTRCDRVFAGGLSMGTLLSILLALRHPEVPGVVLYAPAAKVQNRVIYLTPVAKHILPVFRKSGDSDLGDPQAETRFWSYEAYPVRAAHELLKLSLRVRRLLPRVTCPALIFHAARAKHIRAEHSQYVYEAISSEDKELITLPNSGHALTVDAQWELVAQKTAAFLDRLA